MSNFFDGFGKIRYYIIVMSGLVGVYLWASITGTRFSGDDNELKEEPRGRTHAHGNGFYHK
jgi:hypothetical protein